MGVCLPVLTLRWTGRSSRMWPRLRPETTGIDATSSTHTHPPTLSPGSAWTQKWMKGLVWWCTFGLSVKKSHVFTVSKVNEEEVVTKHLSSPSEVSNVNLYWSTTQQECCKTEIGFGTEIFYVSGHVQMFVGEIRPHFSACSGVSPNFFAWFFFFFINLHNVPVWCLIDQVVPPKHTFHNDLTGELWRLRNIWWSCEKRKWEASGCWCSMLWEQRQCKRNMILRMTESSSLQGLSC